MKMERATVLGHVEAGREYKIITLRAPLVASQVKPGQFVHVLVPRLEGSVLRRPFSVFKASAGTISILYKRVGRGTASMTTLAARDEVSLIGPLGNGFPLDKKDKLPVLVAGGYGVAPLYFLASRMAGRGVILIGAASADGLLCVEEFKDLGWEVEICTNDGSAGRKGFVTDILDARLAKDNLGDEPEFFACGPDGMLKAVAERATARNLTAWLSLDKHMGCGVGACLACVTKIRGKDGSEAWKRVCKDGPVFESREIVWQEDPI